MLKIAIWQQNSQRSWERRIQALTHEKSRDSTPQSEISVVQGEILKGMFLTVPHWRFASYSLPPWKTVQCNTANVWIWGQSHYLQIAGKVSGISKLSPSEVALLFWRETQGKN